jgi:phytoene synthase
VPNSIIRVAPQHDLRINPDDLVVCQRILAAGSKSFAAASRILPKHVREPTAVLYAFCRVADDAVDLGENVPAAIISLRSRLDHAYAGMPENDPVDRALSLVVTHFRIPRALLDALLEGFEWDADKRRYATVDELARYCARVASTVGAMMNLLMGSRSESALARSCELGLAMQLTNICRDVGEDARNGRIYLPLDWLQEANINIEAFLAEPRFTPALGEVVKRVLALADWYYRRAKDGVRLLPRNCRVGVRAAQLIYSEIGRKVAQNGYDSVSRRAYTTKTRKLTLLLRALPSYAWWGTAHPLPPVEATEFLIAAVTRGD